MSKSRRTGGGGMSARGVSARGAGGLPPGGILHALFPHARAEMLRLLFIDPTRERYVSELKRESTLRLSTVQQELRGMEAVGLITSRATGYRKFFRANRQHALCAILEELVATAGKLAAGTKDRRAFVSKRRRPRRGSGRGKR